MRKTRALTSTLAMAVVAGTLSLAPLSAALADPSGGTTFDLPSYDGTFTGAVGDRHVYYRTDAGQGFKLADLGTTGQATFSTVVRTDAAIADWPATGSAELEAVGFVHQIAGESFTSGGATFTGGNPLGSPQHDGDPVLFGQYNGGGPGNPFCANDKFYVNSNWVFGTGTACANVNDDASQAAPVDGGAQRFTVTIDADGSWTGSVTPLDATGKPISSQNFIGTPDDQHFSGTLPGDATTTYVPMIRLRAGDTSSDWAYDVSDTSLVTTGWDSCPVGVDAATMTATLTADCTTAKTLLVPDGWTLDGAGHTITATENGTTFTGAVLANSGASMNVRNLNIATSGWDGAAKNSGGDLDGIKLLHASGTLSNVSIDGISHGNGVQEGKAVLVDNRSGSAHQTVNMDQLTVSNYQKNGVDVRGDVSATLTNSTVGAAGSPEGAPLDKVIASNSVVVAYGASAVISDNHITGNDWDGDTSTNATGVLAYQAGKVTVERNVLGGEGTDVAVDVENSQNVTVDCNLLSRTADDAKGIDPWHTGVLSVTNASLVVRDNTITGFPTDTDGTANVVNQGRCGPAMPTVTVTGITSTDATVQWTAGPATDYAPVTGWELTGPSGSVDLAVGTTSYALTGLQAGRSYAVSVRAVNVSGHSGWVSSLLTATPATVAPVVTPAPAPVVTPNPPVAPVVTPAPAPVVYASTWTSPGTVVYDAKATARGRLTGNGVGVTATTVTLSKLDKGAWVKVGTAITAADGTWKASFTPTRTMAVRATATGFPTAIGTVVVASKVSVKAKALTADVAVSPKLAGTTALLQKHVGSAWVTVATAKLSAKSAVTLTAKSKGVYRVVVRAAGDFAQGTSKTFGLKK